MAITYWARIYDSPDIYTDQEIIGVKGGSFDIDPYKLTSPVYSQTEGRKFTFECMDNADNVALFNDDRNIRITIIDGADMISGTVLQVGWILKKNGSYQNNGLLKFECIDAMGVLIEGDTKAYSTTSLYQSWLNQTFAGNNPADVNGQNTYQRDIFFIDPMINFCISQIENNLAQPIEINDTIDYDKPFMPVINKTIFFDSYKLGNTWSDDRISLCPTLNGSYGGKLKNYKGMTYFIRWQGDEPNSLISPLVTRWVIYQLVNGKLIFFANSITVQYAENNPSYELVFNESNLTQGMTESLVGYDGLTYTVTKYNNGYAFDNLLDMVVGYESQLKLTASGYFTPNVIQVSNIDDFWFYSPRVLYDLLKLKKHMIYEELGSLVIKPIETEIGSQIEYLSELEYIKEPVPKTSLSLDGLETGMLNDWYRADNYDKAYYRVEFKTIDSGLVIGDTIRVSNWLADGFAEKWDNNYLIDSLIFNDGVYEVSAFCIKDVI